MSYIQVRIAVFGRIIAAAAMFTIVGYGALSWAPALFDRRYGIPPAQSGAFIGGIMIVGGTAGPLLSGWLSDHLAQRRVRAARMWPVIMGTWVLVPAAAWAVMPSVNLAILLLAFLNFSISMVSASMPIILQHLTPNRMRGQVIALYMLVLSVAGVGFGPMSVGLLTDYVFRSEALLHWSIVTIAAPASLLCAWLCWRAIAAYQALELDDQGVSEKPQA